MSTTAIADQQAKTKRLPQPKLLTYNDYARLTPPDSGNYELHNGKIIYMPSPLALHQIASSNLHTELGYFVKRHQLGRILAAPMDVRFTPNDVVQPDLMFIKNDNISIIQRIVEIKSDSNTATEMVYKKYLYEVSGVKEYWIIYPKLQTVRQYELIDDELHHVRTLTTSDDLESMVLTGFSMPVSAIFE
jgi:Uma2 family endonuclease